jgi:hypothetical protein
MGTSPIACHIFPVILAPPLPTAPDAQPAPEILELLRSLSVGVVQHDDGTIEVCTDLASAEECAAAAAGASRGKREPSVKR